MRIQKDVHESYRAWFSITPDRWQRDLNQSVVKSYGVDPRRVPFLIARFLTGVAFCGLAGWFAWRAWRYDGPDVRERMLEMAFLTIAWFWLLCPTLNPWYWSWALPLLPFARSRVWWLMSGVLFTYYLRFWLTYHFAETPVAGHVLSRSHLLRSGCYVVRIRALVWIVDPECNDKTSGPYRASWLVWVVALIGRLLR